MKSNNFAMKLAVEFALAILSRAGCAKICTRIYTTRIRVYKSIHLQQLAIRESDASSSLINGIFHQRDDLVDNATREKRMFARYARMCVRAFKNAFQSARVSAGKWRTRKNSPGLRIIYIYIYISLVLFRRNCSPALSSVCDIFSAMLLPEILSNLKIGLNVSILSSSPPSLAVMRRYGRNTRVGVAFVRKLAGTPYATFSSVIDGFRNGRCIFQ